MEENIQAEALQDEIEEKKDYSSFENYTKKQLTLIGYLLVIKEFHITNPPFDQAYLQKIKGTKEIEIIRALLGLRNRFTKIRLKVLLLHHRIRTFGAL